MKRSLDHPEIFVAAAGLPCLLTSSYLIYPADYKSHRFLPTGNIVLQLYRHLTARAMRPCKPAYGYLKARGIQHKIFYGGGFQLRKVTFCHSYCRDKIMIGIKRISEDFCVAWTSGHCSASSPPSVYHKILQFLSIPASLPAAVEEMMVQMMAQKSHPAFLYSGLYLASSEESEGPYCASPCAFGAVSAWKSSAGPSPLSLHPLGCPHLSCVASIALT